MSKLSKFLERRELLRRGYHPGRPEDLWRELITKYAPGRTLVDVGCMWKVNGDYTFVAAAKGATAVTGIDVNPATREFTERNAALGNPVRFIHGDLNDPAIETWAGSFDVVFCSGVLYHVPNPIFSLTQLRRLCRERLILGTASLLERDHDLPNAAVLLVGLDARPRARLTYATQYAKRGLDSEFASERGYANWIWLPTPGCVRAMLDLAGFTVEEFYPSKWVTTAVAKPAKAMAWGATLGREGAAPDQKR